MTLMRTTCGSIRPRRRVAIACLAVALQAPVAACTSTTQFARPDTDARQFAADSKACAEIAPAVVGALATGGFGAIYGAAAASQGARPAGIALFAALGALIGLTASTMASRPGADYDRCMEMKGYRPV
jgi:hypothetical protein